MLESFLNPLDPFPFTLLSCTVARIFDHEIDPLETPALRTRALVSRRVDPLNLRIECKAKVLTVFMLLPG